MKLTIKEAEMLQSVRDDSLLPIESSLVHKKTVDNLLSTGLIRCNAYVNGKFLEVTSLGQFTLKNLDIKK